MDEFVTDIVGAIRGITQIIDGTGDGLGNALDSTNAVAVDGSGNVYVTGRVSDSAFRITSGGAIAEIIDSTGDALGDSLENAWDVAVDGNGNAYVTGANGNNAFKIKVP